MFVRALAVGLHPLVNVIPVDESVDFFVPNPAAVAPEAFFWDLVPTTDVLYVAMLVLVGFGLVACWPARGALPVSSDSSTLADRGAGPDRFLDGRLGRRHDRRHGRLRRGVHPGAAGVTRPFRRHRRRVLRYRLYDIDRLISRTLSWAIVTAAS